MIKWNGTLTHTNHYTGVWLTTITHVNGRKKRMKYFVIGLLSAIIMNQYMISDVQGVRRAAANIAVFIIIPVLYAEVESIYNEIRRKIHE